MSRILPSLVLLILVCASAFLGGCIGGQNQGSTGTTPQPGGPPSVTIISPSEGAILPAGDITVSVRVMNFTLVPEYGQPFVQGQGHLHYYMSVGVPAPGGSSSAVAPISYAATTATSYTWQDVPAGTYTFTVELANSDHSPFPQPVLSRVTVRVIGELPASVAATTIS